VILRTTTALSVLTGPLHAPIPRSSNPLASDIQLNARALIFPCICPLLFLTHETEMGDLPETN
jgi:hypothetical protein